MALINCPECNNEVSDSAVTCPRCGYDLRRQKYYIPTQKKSKASGFSIFLITLLFILVIGFFFRGNGDKSNNNSTVLSKEEIEKNVKNRIKENAIGKPSKTNDNFITYEVVKRWSIPNGGEGKIILISHKLFNEKDMIALGEKLRNDTFNDRNAFVKIYDSRDAINLRDRYESEKTSSSENKFYEKHMLAQYSKNGNTGYHEYNIFLWGFMNDNYKTIKY
jgi:hypothetical protein